ncbi:MAG: sulfite exporter TauE/SafE family protein, partial [Alphaproteobacteria bacterium]
MDIGSLTLLVCLSVFVGVLIGGVGIGGILLVPMLTTILSIDVHVAVAAAMFSYMFSGIVGTWIYAKKRSIEWSMVFWLLASAAPAAFLGAYALAITPAGGVKFLIAILVIFAALNAFRARRNENQEKPSLSSGALIGTGVLTGVGSALSGTGGPLIVVPMLVWLKQPALVAIGLAQTVQVPIAIMATAGNYVYGTVDFQTGGLI